MNINPNIRKDDLGRFACPNERCKLHGLRDRGNVRVNGFSFWKQEEVQTTRMQGVR